MDFDRLLSLQERQTDVVFGHVVECIVILQIDFFSVTRVGLKVNIQSCTCSQLTKLTVSQSIYAKRVVNMAQQSKMALLMITLWLIRMENPETLYRRVVTAVVVPFKI